MELSPGWVSASAAVIGLIGGGLIRWVDSSIVSIKGTQKLIFEKHDHLASELQVYKLHVAESYVNREVLREQLAPINKALEKIDDDLRDMRKG